LRGWFSVSGDNRARTALWFAGIAITSKICQHDGKVLGELIRDLVPSDVGLRVTMDKEKGRTARRRVMY
jgi:hypothetical protein